MRVAQSRHTGARYGIHSHSSAKKRLAVATTGWKTKLVDDALFLAKAKVAGKSLAECGIQWVRSDMGVEIDSWCAGRESLEWFPPN
jgi:hypothetical protein